jgi:L-fuculokinase
VKYAIAVVDIGKTNKKLSIYTPDLECVASTVAGFPALTHDGIEVEDTEGFRRWLISELSELASRFPIGVIAIAAHGATFACVDENMRLTVPVISYTNEPGEAFHRRFYDRVGSPAELQRSTATLRLPALLNLAEGIAYAAERYGEGFTRTRSVLFYPQYWGAQLTGTTAAEITYAACHTYLWDFVAGGWSNVANTIGLVDLLPPRIGKPWDVLDTVTDEFARWTGVSPDTIVTYGIHDSNASLLPYLITTKGDFVVNSTGTWCVAMHPVEEVGFADDEIGAAVFYNISAFGQPVKSAILMGGFEYDAIGACIEDQTGVADRSFSLDLYRQVIAERKYFVTPGVVPGSGQYPDSVASLVGPDFSVRHSDLARGTVRLPESCDGGALYAALNISLALQSRIALNRIGCGPGTPIFTEGGFRNNAAYLSLLAGLFPDSELRLTGFEEATSFGTAISAKVAIEGIDARWTAGLFTIKSEEVEPAIFEGIEAYIAEFDRIVSRCHR